MAELHKTLAGQLGVIHRKTLVRDRYIDLEEITQAIWDEWMKRKVGSAPVPYNLDDTKKLYNYLKKDLLKKGSNTKLVKEGRKEYIVW